MPKADKPIDWAGIERDYRAGVMSIREIARWYTLTEGAIRKKAKKDGWERRERPRETPRQVLTGEIIAAPTAKLEELPDRARGITARLLDELDSVTAHVGELEDMISEEEGDPRRRQALLKAVSLSERAMTLKNLSLTMKTLNEAAVPEGKKAQTQKAADEVGGRFGVRQAPKLAVDNTR